MKGIRGRYGQHMILDSKILSMHLLHTELLSSSTFFDFLMKYDFVVIKPIVGPQEIHITVTDKVIALNSGVQILHFINIDEMYDYLIEHICTKKYYIIQAFPSSPSTLSHFRFTLHRKSRSSNWKIVHRTTVDGNNLPTVALFFVWKLNNILRIAAKKLGVAFPECPTIIIDIVKNSDGTFWLTDTILHDRNSKWSQYHSLQRKRSLRPSLPATELCTKKTLLAFLNTYPEVIIKPCVGQQGRGIVKISMTGEMNFEVHEKQSITGKNDFEELYKYIFEQYLSKKDYIVQQRISLPEINESPFDVRVITQLDEDRWIITGMVVKVAAKNYFVSNRASKLLTLEDAFLNTTIGTSYEHCAKSIEVVCKKASKRLRKSVGNISIIGFDIGINRKGAVWIIEGNYAPSLSMFYMFRNNEIHERISYYIKKNKKSD